MRGVLGMRPALRPALTPIAQALKGLGLFGFSMYSLFRNNEQGVWYDPSDMSTLFQDAAGTIPVTAMEQPVGLMLDKRLGLVRGPERLTNGDFAAGSTGWVVSGEDATHIVTFTDGKVRYQSDTTSPVLVVQQNGALEVGKWYEVTTVVSAWAGGSIKTDSLGGAVLATGVGTFTVRAFAPASTALTIARNSANVDITIDSISVRELPGNHASQATTASKPVLSARKNLLLGTDTLTVTNWVRSAATVTANADGTFDHIDFAAGASSQVYHNVTPGVATVTLSVKAKVASGSKKFRLKYYNGTADSYSAEFTASTTPQTFTYTFTGAAGGNVAIVNEAAGTAGQIFVDEPQLEYGSTATRYQRVNTATDYDWVGFPMYLKFDGVGVFLQTGNIDFTATDKVTVVAGVRKLSDAATAMLLEHSVNLNNNAGTFWLLGPVSAGGNDFNFLSRGSVSPGTGASATGMASPVTAVITGIGNIAADSMIIRANGVQAGTASGDQGTGTYGNYPLYIGRRGGTSLPFNGYLYQLGIRGALTEDAKLKPWERDTGNKTGVTIA